MDINQSMLRMKLKSFSLISRHQCQLRKKEGFVILPLDDETRRLGSTCQRNQDSSTKSKTKQTNSSRCNDTLNSHDCNLTYCMFTCWVLHVLTTHSGSQTDQQSTALRTRRKLPKERERSQVGWCPGAQSWSSHPQGSNTPRKVFSHASLAPSERFPPLICKLFSAEIRYDTIQFPDQI
jgi:hypothetical protein